MSDPAWSPEADRDLSITVETCPGCAAHLSDTWDGEACSQCGFQYVYQEVKRVERTRRRPAVVATRSSALGALGLIVAMTAGTMVSLQDVSIVRDAPSGVLLTIDPTSAVWGAVGMMMVAMGLLVAALTIEKNR